MAKITYNKTTAGYASPLQNSESRETPIGMTIQTTVQKGYAGTLSARTSNSEGTLTLSAGHGITSGQQFDLYWDEGCRRNLQVGTVSGTSVPFTGTISTGDNLPALNFAVVASPQHIFDVAFTRHYMEFMSMLPILANGASGVKCLLTLAGANTSEAPETIEPTAGQFFDLESGKLWIYDKSGGDIEPFESDYIYQVIISNGSSVSNMTFRALILSDPTGESSS